MLQMTQHPGGVADPERLGTEDALAAAVGLEPPALLCHLGGNKSG